LAAVSALAASAAVSAEARAVSETLRPQSPSASESGLSSAVDNNATSTGSSIWDAEGGVRSTPGSSLHFESGPHPPVDVPDLFAETAMLTGRLDAMLNRLTLEGEGFDDGVARSVRRALQIGTVLAGQRLSDEEIRALPKVRFEQEELHQCSICLENYQQGELLTQLCCGHFFHVPCLARWMQRATQCPLCRTPAADDLD